MKTTTHVESLTSLARSIHDGANKSETSSNTAVISVLARQLGMDIKSHQFLRIMTWIIAFYNDSLESIQNSSLSEKNKQTALSNLRSLFAPLLPPFTGGVKEWYARTMSATNESYFDLLSDTLKETTPIYLPSNEQISDFRNKLTTLSAELNDLSFPKWINDEFNEAIFITTTALDKMPFLAHRIIRDSHGNILSKLFTVGNEKQKSYIVKLATTINIVLAAFVMPHEATEAASAYYDWTLASPIDVKQIEACAKPLALPAPKVSDT